MDFQVRFTEEALADLERLYDFVLERSEGDWSIAERALASIVQAIESLRTAPFGCRRASGGDAFLRELVIGFGASGYVALFEIEDASTVTVLAVRHQREDDWR